MTLDSLPILNDGELHFLHAGGMYEVSEKAEIEFRRVDKNVVKLAYVLGKTSDGRLVFSTYGLRDGSTIFGGGWDRFDYESEVSVNIEIWNLSDIKSYSTLHQRMEIIG